MPCDGPQNDVIIAVFRSVDEFCDPVYKDIISGSNLVFTNKIISVPVINP